MTLKEFMEKYHVLQDTDPRWPAMRFAVHAEAIAELPLFAIQECRTRMEANPLIVQTIKAMFTDIGEVASKALDDLDKVDLTRE